MAIDDAIEGRRYSAFRMKNTAMMVRVVSIGDYSKEFCGGTHVKEHQDRSVLFHILSEAGVASGVQEN